MDPQKARCRTWSPYSVAGWLPAAPETIQDTTFAYICHMWPNGSKILIDSELNPVALKRCCMNFRTYHIL